MTFVVRNFRWDSQKVVRGHPCLHWMNSITKSTELDASKPVERRPQQLCHLTLIELKWVFTSTASSEQQLVIQGISSKVKLKDERNPKLLNYWEIIDYSHERQSLLIEVLWLNIWTRTWIFSTQRRLGTSEVRKLASTSTASWLPPPFKPSTI